MSEAPTEPRWVRRFPTGTSRQDPVVVEEPLEIHLDGEPLAVLMRTPGADLALAAGFLLTEGLIEARTDLRALAPCQDPGVEQPQNRILAVLAEGCGGAPMARARARRAFVTGSSCGLCGKVAIESLLVEVRPHPSFVRLDLEWIAGVEELARPSQQAFGQTGGLHGAVLFGPPPERAVLTFAEDVGRHNAVDKVLGTLLLQERLPVRESTLWISGRASFEMVQKALRGGVRALVAVGAPTTMAIDLARQSRLALVGFARAGAFNVYAPESATD